MEQRNNLRWILDFAFLVEWAFFFVFLVFFLPRLFPEFSPPWLEWPFCGVGNRVTWSREAGLIPTAYCSQLFTEVPFFFIAAINAGLALVVAIVLHAPMRLALGLGRQGPGSTSSDAVGEWQRSVAARPTSYMWDGKSYDSLQSMPPEGRAQFEVALSMLEDRDGDGVPDMLQGNVLEIIAGLRDFIKRASPMQEELKRLAEQRKQGLISHDEFETRLRELAERAKYS